MSNVIPFGKYKDQPIEQMLLDQKYCQWLLQQAWFQQQYSAIHSLVINGGVKVEDTPAHNKLQARFLNPIFCKKFVRACGVLTKITDIQTEFEMGVFQIDVWLTIKTDQYPKYLGIEVKPAIGDDYPAILRQAKSKCLRDHNGISSRYCMVNAIAYEHFTASSVTLKQV